MQFIAQAAKFYSRYHGIKPELHNPTTGFRMTEPESDPRWVTPEDAEKLIKAARTMRKAPYLWAILQLAFQTGLRKGELLNLPVADLDLTERVIRLSLKEDRQKYRKQNAGTKNKRNRNIPINDSALEAISYFLRFRAQHCLNSRLLIVNTSGSPVGDIKKSVERCADLAGVEGFSLHWCRHSFGSWLAMSGTDLIKIRDLMGHSSVKTTEIYARITDKSLAPAVAALPDLKTTVELREVL